MTEAQYQTKFKNLLLYWKRKKEYPFKIPSVFELKVARGDKFYFNQIKPHQLHALRSVAENNNGLGLYYKIPDVGPARKPFDCFHLLNMGAYVVIFFPKKDFFFTLTINQVLETIEHGTKVISYEELNQRNFYANRFKL